MLHLIEALEERPGAPVVSANLAPYWQAMRAAQIDDAISFAARLFEEST